MIQHDPTNTIFEQAVAFVNHTSRHLFLTGKAGTGKTTFLKYIKENSAKKMAILAPTGVAAINAGGVTIHSFFQLPFGPFVPTLQGIDTSMQVHNRHSIFHNIRLNTAKRELIQELELLVIDEVSMVRADMMDAIDVVLRHFRRQPLLPFGGVQMLYIGDLFQLPPVVKNEEWDILHHYYKSPFFFDAEVMQNVPLVFIELKKIYRQTDNTFIDLLNNVRNNCCTEKDITLLNSHHKLGFSPPKGDHYITLTSHNYLAKRINEDELEKLGGRKYNFKATITGEFSERSFPVEEVLQLKVGAQIMFIKNDKGEDRRFYNGKIGTIKSITDEKIEVQCKDEEMIELEKEVWRNINYHYNKEDDTIEEDELGTFTHYPIRLAWAITIHKSQGLTFDKAIVDAGASFAPGQVYVALSRLTGLQGLVLHSLIHPHSISTDAKALAFSTNEMPEHELQKMLHESQLQFIRQSLLQTFEWTKLTDEMNRHHENYETRKIPDKEKSIQWSANILATVDEQREVAEKFHKQLTYLLSTCEQDQYKELNKRIEAAVMYFSKNLEDKIIAPLKLHLKEEKVKKQTKKYIKELSILLLLFTRKNEDLQKAAHVTKALATYKQVNEIAGLVVTKSVTVIEKEYLPIKPSKGETFRITLEMFKSGKSIADIATARTIAASTVESHLARFITTKEIAILELVDSKKLENILAVLNSTQQSDAAIVRQVLGNDYSFSEIIACIHHWQLIKEVKSS